MRRTQPSFSTELASVLAPTIRLSVSLAFILVAVYDMIQGTRMTKTLQYISVKNKGFLAGDRFKKKGFFIVHLENSEGKSFLGHPVCINGSPGIMKARATTL